MRRVQKNYQMHGGLRLRHKQAITIEYLQNPETLRIPLQQHQGPAAPVIVALGETVSRGQPLTMSGDYRSVPVHASLCGIVRSITRTAIELQTFESSATWQSPANSHSYKAWAKPQLREHLHQLGLVGLGGACFPVAAKLAAHSNSNPTLVINAAECDPYICCDEALLHQHSAEVLSGIEIAIQATGARDCIIYIEEGKNTTASDLQKLIENCGSTGIDIVSTAAIYPGGAETQILSSVSGKPYSRHRNKTDSPLISFNIGTCYAMYQAAVYNSALTTRITTVIDPTGQARNFSLPIGTSLSYIADCIGINSSMQTRFSGGRMMAQPMPSDAVIEKSSNCIEYRSRETAPTERECIRCGLCTDVCPEQLQPQQLYVSARQINEKVLSALDLQQCIECRCCDFVCPSKLPLTRIFQQTKSELASRAKSKLDADIAKQRFEKRESRLQRQALEQAEKLAKKKQALETTRTSSPLSKKQLIEQALQRAKAKKQSTSRARTTSANTTSASHTTLQKPNS
ncbi:hypothetical protein AB833_04735 [Chromatiales bacterium (ex Bugula neritina AB1)]|nr:hypothetical protein AB833_04735 [Chromatiales bacterium (ex Bugula neritina AB1)]